MQNFIVLVKYKFISLLNYFINYSACKNVKKSVFTPRYYNMCIKIYMNYMQIANILNLKEWYNCYKIQEYSK